MAKAERSRKARLKLLEEQQAAERAERASWLDRTRVSRQVSALVSFFAILSVYLLTVCRTIHAGDTGEFITAGYQLGVAHPPGYPLYTLLARVFTWIPFGSIAYRVNLLSAVCNALACAILGAGVTRWTRSFWVGVFAAGLFAFSPDVWEYAVLAEVFSLNHVFVALLLYALVRFEENRELRWANLGAVILGFGLSNHVTLLFIGLPIACFVGWRLGPRLREPRVLLTLLGLGALGFIPYLYLPWASARAPLMAWGDQTTLDGFLRHLLRKEYGSFDLGPNQKSTGFWTAIGLYVRRMPHELLYVGPLLAAFGLFRGLRDRQRTDRAMLYATLSAFLAYLIIFHNLGMDDLSDPHLLNEVQVAYWMQANLLVCVWAALGFHEIVRLSAGTAILRAAIPALGVVAIGLQLGLNYRASDKSRNHLFHDFGTTVLEQLPQGSLVLTRGDIFHNVIRYLQLCEKIRPDVKLLDLALLKAEWFPRVLARHFPEIGVPPGASFTQLIDANIGARPVFVSMNVGEITAPEFAERYVAIPSGFVRRIQPVAQGIDWGAMLAEQRAARERFNYSGYFETKPGSWESIVWENYWASESSAAAILSLLLPKLRTDAAFVAATRAYYQEVLGHNPSPPRQLAQELASLGSQ